MIRPGMKSAPVIALACLGMAIVTSVSKPASTIDNPKSLRILFNRNRLLLGDARRRRRIILYAYLYSTRLGDIA